ncbi:hypothetical protein [Paracoccus aestuariivivens]|uniref:Uncharacterized protein n=1 Tax=Paracoccus aestuariivivens TaxID=1820333 RepID=A0A6L6JEN4_9RHOB|nr:hypothetical protein [Paracoccus aestuariivivens]MTH79695.1 hypothetical protein [Paracoccus aestuariivivens]
MNGSNSVASVTLVISAIAEIATGLALVVRPSPLAELLLGVEIFGVAVGFARIAGIALVGLGIACWPGSPRAGMIIYGFAVAVYLAYLAISGVATGVAIWPVIVAHLTISAALLWFRR